jgi:hypothetical protein
MDRGYIPVLITLLVDLVYIIFTLVITATFTLPDDIPSRIDYGGEVTEFMSQTSFLVLHGFLNLGLPLALTALFWFMPRIPDAYVNVPYKDWFLQHPALFHKLKVELSQISLWLPAILAAMITIMYVVVVGIALDWWGGKSASSVIVYVSFICVAFILVVVVFMVRLAHSVRKNADEENRRMLGSPTGAEH